MAITNITANLAANTTYTAGTYYMNNSYSMNGKTITFDCSGGSIYFKRADNAAWTSRTRFITTNSSATNKVYITSKNDDTIGETVPGSTGSPSATTGEWSSTVETYSYKYWEVRYCNCGSAPLIGGWETYSSTATNIVEYIVFKNCGTGTNVGYPTIWMTGGASSKFDNIIMDKTNTCTMQRGIVIYYNVNNGTISNIYWNPAGNTASQAFFWYQHTVNVTMNDCYFTCNDRSVWWQFLVEVSPSSGKTTTLNRCYIGGDFGDIDGSNTTTITANDCIFERYIVSDQTTPPNITVNNCIFIYSAFQTKTGKTVTATNCIFAGGCKIINGGAGYVPTVVSSYNGFYNCDETNWTRGTGDFTADPAFRTVTGGTIATYASATPFMLPDGYMPSSSAYVKTGSNTYDNLSIDETIYSPNGYKHLGTENIWPGIYYRMDVWGAQHRLFMQGH